MVYLIRLKDEFTTFEEASQALANIKSAKIFKRAQLQVGYYMPQRKFKSWVPGWLIRILTQ